LEPSSRFARSPHDRDHHRTDLPDVKGVGKASGQKNRKNHFHSLGVNLRIFYAIAILVCAPRVRSTSAPLTCRSRRAKASAACSAPQKPTIYNSLTATRLCWRKYLWWGCNDLIAIKTSCRAHVRPLLSKMSFAMPTEQAGDSDSYIWKQPIAVTCTVETAHDAESRYHTIPIAPGAQSQQTCAANPILPASCMRDFSCRPLGYRFPPRVGFLRVDTPFLLRITRPEDGNPKREIGRVLVETGQEPVTSYLGRFFPEILIHRAWPHLSVLGSASSQVPHYRADSRRR
jgi:hypothetical protein